LQKPLRPDPAGLFEPFLPITCKGPLREPLQPATPSEGPLRGRWTIFPNFSIHYLKILFLAQELFFLY
jgi:hypothetical protein